MIVCPVCRRENEDHNNFCLACGANLKVLKVKPDGADQACPECGTLVPVSFAFCGKCGSQLWGKTSANQAVPERGTEGAAAALVAEPNNSQAKLVLINPDGSSGQVIPLHSGENIFGREHGADLFRDDPFLSPRHAAFILRGEQLEVRDLGSLNGIFYRIVEATELEHGDLIRVGRQVLAFEILEKAPCVLPTVADGVRALGAPWGDAWGRLVRVSAPKHSSQAFVLAAPEEVIGRERGTVLIRDDGFVSARHCRVTVSGGRYYLEDLRSSNGTFLMVRGRRLIKHGDLLLMGQQPLRAYLSP